MIKQIIKELQSVSDKERAQKLMGFFKTGKGEYGEGDIFIGITNPNLRAIAKKYYKEMSNEDVLCFLQHEIHEYRLFALICMTHKFDKTDEKGQKEIYDLYLANTKHINNWDLVDISAHKIVGKYVKDRDRKILYKLAKSKDLWEQRISIISTMAFLKDNDFKDILKISEMLVNHEHDLIHKAVGWLLREIGKRDLATEEKFLKKYYKTMPRTMLRYAIERFEENKRQGYLKGTI